MIAIIDYKAGNIRSVMNALQRLGEDHILTNDISELEKADKIILPGVGEASTAMKSLNQFGLVDFIQETQQAFLGICLGMQLMCAHSEEGNVKCLGIFDTIVKRFPAQEKVPHMGWNDIHSLKGPLFYDLQEGSDVYFVHSYYAEPSGNTVATCDYILPFAAAIQKDNFYATQFHPEKSGSIGASILQNFIQL